MGSPRRPAGIGRLASVAANTSSTVLPVAAALFSAASSIASLWMRPGTMQFDSTPCFENPFARFFEKLIRAAFDAEYGAK